MVHNVSAILLDFSAPSLAVSLCSSQGWAPRVLGPCMWAVCGLRCRYLEAQHVPGEPESPFLRPFSGRDAASEPETLWQA